MEKLKKKDIMRYLSVLGINGRVSIKLLKTRYKELSKQHHPDLNSKNKKDFMSEINQAFNALLNYLENVEIDLLSNTIKPETEKKELWDKKFGQDFFFGGTK